MEGKQTTFFFSLRFIQVIPVIVLENNAERLSVHLTRVDISAGVTSKMPG